MYCHMDHLKFEFSIQMLRQEIVSGNPWPFSAIVRCVKSPEPVLSLTLSPAKGLSIGNVALYPQ